MKIVIIGGGPCGLGAAWRTEEIRRQGRFLVDFFKEKRFIFLLKVIQVLIGLLLKFHQMLVVLLEQLLMTMAFYGIWVVM
jgi:hypothetical protein